MPNQRSVLVVDDEWGEHLQDIVMPALDASLYQWNICGERSGKGAELILKDRNNDVDVVLLDIEMLNQPRQGPELLAAFKGIDPSLPVVILSAKKVSAPLVQRVLNQGAVFYCEKKTLNSDPGILKAVLDATQQHPEEREFQQRIHGLALPADQEECQAMSRLLARALSAISMQSIDEFESASEEVGVSTVSKWMSETRAQLMLGGAALAACQVGDRVLDWRSKQARETDSDGYETRKENISNRAERLGDRQARGRRLAARTVQILTLQEMNLLTPDMVSMLVTLGAFRDLLASPHLDRAADSRADAIFLMDLALSLLEDLFPLNRPRDHSGKHLQRALAQQELWGFSKRALSGKIRGLPDLVEKNPPEACLQALAIVRYIRCEIAVQLQSLGAAIPASWDPRHDGSEGALQVFHAAARKTMGRKFPPGVWGRSEKFFAGYGLPIERLCEVPRERGVVPTWQGRLAARACLAVSDWWVTEYLPWCEKVDWREVNKPRTIPQKGTRPA